MAGSAASSVFESEDKLPGENLPLSQDSQHSRLDKHFPQIFQPARQRQMTYHHHKPRDVALIQGGCRPQFIGDGKATAQVGATSK
jgi:hypothetical protein